MARKRFAALVVSVLVLSGTATAVPLLVGGKTAGASTTTQFTTPGCSTYTVPAAVNQVEISAFGAQGGNNSQSTGGQGGAASGLLNVSPGQQLDVCVGGDGDGTGFNGGGASGGSATNQPPGAKGGGASDVRTGAFQLSDRVLVAGGGGGAAGFEGGDPGGGSSAPDCTSLDASCGGSGTQTAGGAAGAAPTAPFGCTLSNATSGTPGALGLGGSGGSVAALCGMSFGFVTAGGGGGGYYGGGGGSGGSPGGGGSGFVALSLQAPGQWTNTAGVRSGNGEVDITPKVAAPFAIATVSLPVATHGSPYGPVTLQATNLGVSASPYTTTVKWFGAELPKGMTLSSAGVLSGTPNAKLLAGPYSVMVQATETVFTLNGGTKVKTNTTVHATIPLTIQ